MKEGIPVNWKTAAAPLAALTVALVVGVGYFAGGSGETDTAPASAGFKFEQAGPNVAPGPRQAGAAHQSGSSIEMFRSANKGYAAEAGGTGDEPAARRPKDKKRLQEFLQQARHDINMDPAELAASAAAGAQAGESGGRTITNPVLKAGAAGKERQADGAAVRTRQGGGGTAARAGSLNAKRGAFSSGRAGSSLSGGGGGARLNARPGSSFGGSDGGGQSQDTDYAMASGGGRDLEAGAYGSHGGGQASGADFSGAGSSSEQPGAGKGALGPPQEKKIPEAVAFLWPRTFDFGDMYMYETAARQVILMNIGDAAMKVGKIENMDDETPFFVEKDKCSGTALAPGKSCTFRVRFSPKAVRDYVTGFEVPTNDENALNYQGVIEVKGNSKYSYSTWWWHHYWSGPAGYNNRLYFGLVPEGYTMDEVLRITNNTGSEWENVKLDRAALPASFKISGDACTGSNLGPHQSCSVTVTFAPSAGDNRRFSSAYYGQYHAVNYQTGAKSYSARPKFPPLVLEKPVEASPKGTLTVRANFNVLHAGQVVAEVPIGAESSGPFPVTGLARVQHYYFFK